MNEKLNPFPLPRPATPDHPTNPEWAKKAGLRLTAPFWLVLVENTEAGDEAIETIHDVEENEVKYAAAGLVQLAQARGIEVYSIEVAKEKNNANS